MDNFVSQKAISKFKLGLVYKIVVLVLTLLTLAFSAIYFTSLVGKIDISYSDINVGLLILSLIIFISSYCIFSMHWQKMCEIVNDGVAERQYLAFFASQPYKYLPSSIFSFSFRAKFAKDLGIGVKKSSIAQLLENADLVMSGFFVAIIGYAFALSYWTGLVGLILSGLLIVLIYFLSKGTKIKVKNMRIRPDFLIQAFTTGAVGWLFAGISFYILSQSFRQTLDIFDAISVNTLSYIAGLLAVFAPGGIGIREAVFSLFGIVPMLIIGWRILTFLVDMLAGFGAIIYIRYWVNN